MSSLEAEDAYALARSLVRRRVRTGQGNPAEGLPARKELPDEFRVNNRALRRHNWYRKPRKLLYGFGINYLDCIEYHEAHGLELPDPLLDEPTFLLAIADQAREHLSERCNFDELELLPPSTCEFDLVLYLYDSYTIRKCELAEEEEEDVLAIMNREWPSLVDRGPKWFYSLVDS